MYFKEKDINYFWILFLIKSILLIYLIPIISFFLLFIVFFLLIKNNINYRTIFIGILLSMLIYLSLYFNKYENIFFGKLIDTIFNFSIRDWNINFINDNYSSESASIILLFAFSEKTKIGSEIYKSFLDLSISHLIVVSGYHLTFLSSFFNKFIHNKKIKIFIAFIFLFFINYNLNFNFGILRSSLFLLLSFNKKRNSFQTLSLSGIVILFFCPKAILNFSFLMSFLSTFLIILLNKKINRKILFFLLPFLINILLLPLISKLNNYISITGIFFSFIYSNIFRFLFIFSTLNYLFYFLNSFYEMIYFLMIEILNIFELINFKIQIIPMPFFSLIIWYILYFIFLEIFINK